MSISVRFYEPDIRVSRVTGLIMDDRGSIRDRGFRGFAAHHHAEIGFWGPGSRLQTGGLSEALSQSVKRTDHEANLSSASMAEVCTLWSFIFPLPRHVYAQGFQI
jgi:hypothetical protein